MSMLSRLGDRAAAAAQRVQQTIEGAAQAESAPDPHAQQTPYGGCDPARPGTPVVTAPHILVSGPTGRGKTTRILAPGAIMWRGPRVIVSSKTDYLKWLVEKGIAQRGRVYVLDLGGELDPGFPWLRGVGYQMVTSDPCALIASDDDALAMSSLLMKVGSLGASDGAGGGDDAFWQTLSTQVLAALLLAGRDSGGGIDWTLRAAGRLKGESPEDPAPSWSRAYALISETSRHAPDLLAKMEMDAKLRDSVTATMQAGLAPWLLSTVAGREGDDATPFAPRMLEGEGEPTLAIIAPADGVAAGAAVAVIETIIRHWRRGVERGLPRVLLSIDEAVNTAPIPKLPTYITEARGLGVACVIAVQSTNQMKLRWGDAGANVLREVFPAVLILEGAPERELVEMASWWSGETDRWTESIDASSGRSLSAERAQRVSAQSLLPRTVEQGRLLLYGQPGMMVDLPGIWNWPDA